MAGVTPDTGSSAADDPGTEAANTRAAVASASVDANETDTKVVRLSLRYFGVYGSRAPVGTGGCFLSEATCSSN